MYTPKGTAQTFGPEWPTSCWFERRWHSMANCGQMVRYCNGHNAETIGNHRHSSDDPLWPPLPKNGIPNAPLVLCRISNGHIAVGHSIHFMFRVGYGYGFRGRRIEWRYFRFYQTQDGGHEWQKISTRAQRCRLLPNYFVPCRPNKVVNSQGSDQIVW